MKKGLTIIELLVVIGIFTIFLSGGLFLNTNSFRSYYFDAEEKMLVSLIRAARSRALGNINHVPHGVFVSAQSFILFQVESTLSNGAVVFENLSGIPNQTGEIRIFDGIRESIISVESEGRIND